MTFNFKCPDTVLLLTIWCFLTLVPIPHVSINTCIYSFMGYRYEYWHAVYGMGMILVSEQVLQQNICLSLI